VRIKQTHTFEALACQLPSRHSSDPAWYSFVVDDDGKDRGPGRRFKGEAVSQAQDTHTRTVLPSKLAKQVQSQFTAFYQKDMSAYTYEKKKSDFKDAKMDISVFDGDGKLRLLGRDFGRRTFFWEP